MDFFKNSIELEIDAAFKNLRVHAVCGNVLWASSGYTLYRSDNRELRWEKIKQIPAKKSRSFLSRLYLLQRLLRARISNVIPLESGAILVIADRKIYRVLPDIKQIKEVHKIRRGRALSASGFCVDAKGFVYYGEYWLNPKREAVYSYKSSDEGISWERLYSFPQGTVRHVHVFQCDPFTNCLWVATGDKNHECLIAYSKDGGQTLNIIGSGSQQWRTTSLMFTKDYVYWGTDAPDVQNYIYRWKRPRGPVQRLTAVDGPVYYSTVLDNQILLATTGVEKERYRWDPLRILSKFLMRADKEIGLGEWDSFAHLWASVDGERWLDLAKWKKDWLSPFFFGHGLIYLAKKQDIQGYFYFTPMNLKKVSGVTYRARIKSS